MLGEQGVSSPITQRHYIKWLFGDGATSVGSPGMCIWDQIEGVMSTSTSQATMVDLVAPAQ